MADDLATLEARRVEVAAALHELRMGKTVVEVWRDGRRLTYAKANVDDLKGYLSELDGLIADAGGAVNNLPRRGSMRPMFA